MGQHWEEGYCAIMHLVCSLEAMITMEEGERSCRVMSWRGGSSIIRCGGLSWSLVPKSPYQACILSLASGPCLMLSKHCLPIRVTSFNLTAGRTTLESELEPGAQEHHGIGFNQAAARSQCIPFSMAPALFSIQLLDIDGVTFEA